MKHFPASHRRSRPTVPRAEVAALEGPGLDDVERAMERAVRTGGNRVGGMARDQLASGGKRLRARMALGAARAVAWAAAVELLHHATLVHDDIQDQDRMRRGCPTLWVRHGVAQAINAGNFLLTLPYAAVGAMGSSAAGALCLALAEHAVTTVRGQAAELDLLAAAPVDAAAWIAAAAGKTGAMFALPVVGAALLAGRSRDEAERLGAPFVDLGVVFQIHDDVLDVVGGKGREAPGCDLVEGKVSALVVQHLARRPGDAGWLLELLAAPRDATPPSGVARALDAYRASGAVIGALAWMDHITAGALEAPALLAEPELLALAAALAERIVPIATRPLEGVA
jgi:geranylgeranyl pyrophosphate synthase